MIVRKEIAERIDGTKVFRSVSDQNFMLRCDQTGELVPEGYDGGDGKVTYTETGIRCGGEPSPPPPEEVLPEERG